MSIKRIEDPTIQLIPIEPEPEETPKQFDIQETIYKDNDISTIVKQEPIADGYIAVLFPVVGIIIGLLITGFGVWNSGGFYEMGSRLSGGLARIFYVWQVGNLLQIVGVLIIAFSGNKLYGIINDRRTK